MWTLSFEARTGEGERYFVGQHYKDELYHEWEMEWAGMEELGRRSSK